MCTRILFAAASLLAATACSYSGLDYDGKVCDLDRICPSGYQCVETDNLSVCRPDGFDGGNPDCETDQDCVNDELWCNGQTVCQDGDCVFEERDCSDLTDDCNTGACDEDEDLCLAEPFEDGTACYDGLFCTDDDSCQAGVCEGGGPRNCGSETSCVQAGECDEEHDLCAGEPLPAGTACDDSLFCTTDDICDGEGACGGLSQDCTMFDNQCNQGVCVEELGQCLGQPINEGQSCDDGLHCTQGESCQAGSCTDGSELDCDDQEPCTVDSCDEAGDACLNTWVANPGTEGLVIDGSCDDLVDNDCDGETDLDDLDCQPCSDNQDCEDNDPCTANTCNAEHQCESAPNTGASCDDNLGCTSDDQCVGYLCQGTAVSCSHLDGDCRVGLCQEPGGACIAQPVNEGNACDDGVYCNVSETCDEGDCTGGSQRDCSSLDDACNLGLCDDDQDACVAQPRGAGTDCDDGLYCNGSDSCDGSGTCSHAGNPCLTGAECNRTCGEPGDSCTDPSGTACGSPADNSCTSPDSCDDVGQCLPNHDGSGVSCDDGVYCNGADTCDGAGSCQSAGSPCQPDETCDEANQLCKKVLFRSVGIDATDLNILTHTVGISGRTATFSGSMPVRVGVGDVLQYQDADDDWQLAFIHGRESDRIYQVSAASGEAPTACPAGTTVQVYRAYTALANWAIQDENDGLEDVLEDFDQSTDLVAAGAELHVACYADGMDTTFVDVDNWNTSAANFIRIYTPTSTEQVGVSQRHQGSWTTGAYRLVVSHQWYGAIRIKADYLRIEGLQIEQTAQHGVDGTSMVGIGVTVAGGEIVISHNIVRYLQLVTLEQYDNGIGIYSPGSGVTVAVYNNIVYGFFDGITRWYQGDAEVNGGFYNNTVIDCQGTGITAHHASNLNNLHVKNNLVQGSGVADYDLAGHESSAANISGDGSSPDSGYANLTVTLAGPEDYHLDAGDTLARDVGVDLTSDPILVFFNDIDGQPRPQGAGWDVGADEIP